MNLQRQDAKHERLKKNKNERAKREVRFRFLCNPNPSQNNTRSFSNKNDMKTDEKWFHKSPSPYLSSVIVLFSHLDLEQKEEKKKKKRNSKSRGSDSPFIIRRNKGNAAMAAKISRQMRRGIWVKQHKPHLTDAPILPRQDTASLEIWYFVSTIITASTIYLSIFYIFLTTV